jgi:cytochrome c-type biogenesis protein
MQNWLSQILNSGQFDLMAFPAAFLLGLSTFAGAVGCCIPAVVIVAGYAGTRQDQDKRGVFLAAGCFFLGSIVSLSVVGALVSYFGQTLSSQLGFYGEIIVGLIAIFFGCIALELLPFRLPSFKLATDRLPKGMLGASLLGLAVGATSTTCSLTCCAPVQLPIVLGLATMRGEAAKGALILALFAMGYSLPLMALMLGFSLGKASALMVKITKPLRLISGVAFIAMGLWIILP